MPCYAKLDGKTYDFPKTQWYHDGVAYCLNKGILTNKEDGTFGLSDTTTRAMVAEALWAAEGKPKTVTRYFYQDVGEAHPSREAIFWATETGVMSGYGGNTFGAADEVTREQLASILWRYAKYKGYDVSVGEDTNILSYEDAFSISEYAIPAMQWACGAGIINGRDDGTLNPKGTAQKVHTAQMLMNFIKM